MTVNTPAYRPKIFRNRYVIEVFGGVLCCRFVFELSVVKGVFVIVLSKISFFVSWNRVSTCKSLVYA